MLQIRPLTDGVCKDQGMYLSNFSKFCSRLRNANIRMLDDTDLVSAISESVMMSLFCLYFLLSKIC